MNRFRFALKTLMLLLIAFVSGTASVLVFAKIADNVSTGIFFVYMIVLVGVLFLLKKCWGKLYTLFAKAEPILSTVMPVVLGIAMFFVCSKWLYENTAGYFDYNILFVSADAVSKGEALDDYCYRYFLNCTNNLKPMLMLSWLFKLARFLHISGPFFVLILVCATVVATSVAMGALVSEKNDRTWRLPASLLVFVYLPVWGFSSAFYTDTMSFGLCIVALALIRKSDINRKKTYIVFNTLAALLIAFATVWKITAIIPLIAYVIVFFVNENKIGFKKAVLPLAVMAATLISLNLVFGTYDIVKESKTTGDPITSWFAKGMTNDGTWLENSEYGTKIHEFSTKEEKAEYTKQYISENISEAFKVEHIWGKLKVNFSNGNLGVDCFSLVGSDSSFGQMFRQEGKYYTPVTIVDLSVLITVYISIFIIAAVNLSELFRGRENDTLELSVGLSLVSIFVFLMISEANSRQLYNQVPMLLLAIVCFLKKRPGRKQS